MLNRILLVIAGLMLLSSFVQADPVLYTDASSWTAATSDVTTIDFNEVGFEQYYGSGYSNGDLTVMGSSSYLFGWGPPEAQDMGTGNYLIGPYNSGATVTETFSGENQAAGTDLGLYDASGTLDYDFTTFNGDSVTGSVDAVDGSWSFVGIVADSGDYVTSLTITLPTQVGEGFGNIAVDNTSYGDSGVVSTPEPGSLALLGSGMMGLASFLRRRFRSVAISAN
jgi:hypothetical protein